MAASRTKTSTAQGSYRSRRDAFRAAVAARLRANARIVPSKSPKTSSRARVAANIASAATSTQSPAPSRMTPSAHSPSHEPLGAQPIVELRDISKHYGEVTALDRISLELREGEILAIVGDNGAGKSTLMRILSGDIQPSAGTMRVDGEVTSFRRPADATAAGIVTVYQDLALALDVDVASNFFLGKELTVRNPVGKLCGWLDRKTMQAETRAALDRVHIRIPNVTVECGRLSGGQRQALAIARSLESRKKVLLLDEPTAALGVEQQREVLSLVRQVRDMNIAVILVSHQLPHVLALADRVAVLRHGRLTVCLDVGDATEHRLLAAITGLTDAIAEA
jgi:ABC-type sugar transport system ATPase subunit